MAPVTLHQQQARDEFERLEEGRRYHHYMKSSGKSWAAQVQRAHREDEPAPVEELASLDEYRKALEAHGRTLAKLAKAARGLDRGGDRWQAVQLGLDAGFRKSEMARLLGVTPQRVTQMLAEDDCPL